MLVIYGKVKWPIRTGKAFYFFQMMRENKKIVCMPFWKWLILTNK